MNLKLYNQTMIKNKILGVESYYIRNYVRNEELEILQYRMKWILEKRKILLVVRKVSFFHIYQNEIRDAWDASEWKNNRRSASGCLFRKALQCNTMMPCNQTKNAIQCNTMQILQYTDQRMLTAIHHSSLGEDKEFASLSLHQSNSIQLSIKYCI